MIVIVCIRDIEMDISKLESLPTELWLHILSYLSSFDLFKAFFRINNKRIQQIIDSQSFLLNTKLISYSEMNQIFLMHSYLLQLCTIILSNSCSSSAFYKYWTKNLPPMSIIPKLEQLIVLNAGYYIYGLVDSLLIPLSLGNSLQYLHLIFQCSDRTYMMFLNFVIQAKISFHTMIFEIEKDWYCDTEVVYSNLSELNNLHWSRTVQLTLTIQFSFEMIFILQNSAIPFLEHLYITIEQEQLRRKSYLDAPQLQIQFCESDIRQMTDGTRLQTIVLRHLALYNVIILIRSFNMPLLKKLTLVDIFDESKLFK
ncbi:unnamed protein product [Rotaria sp. Silwood2]|nr:unnamed protein product [Rotaria sp. Silwood2]